MSDNTDGNSAVYRDRRISSGQPTVLRGDTPGYPSTKVNVPTSSPPETRNVTNVGSEFFEGKRRAKI